MNIDLPTLNAFALDSATPGAGIATDASTLTLRPPVAAGRPAMGLIARFTGLPVASAETLRASVVQADSVALTITF